MPEIINLRSLFLVFFNRIPELNHNDYIIQKKKKWETLLILNKYMCPSFLTSAFISLPATLTLWPIWHLHDDHAPNRILHPY